MESMFVRVPVAVKAKVTENLKLKIIGDLQNKIKEMNLDLEKFDFEMKKVMDQVAAEHGPVDQVRMQIQAERQKRVGVKEDAEEQLQRAQDLEIGTEISSTNLLERTVEIKIGTDLEALMGAEILTEDGKIIAFRE